MTDALSGFLGPEEIRAVEMRQFNGEPEPPPEVSQAILFALATYGPLTISELLPKVHARDRVVIAALDDLERKHLVRLTEQDTQEFAQITSDGRAAIQS